MRKFLSTIINGNKSEEIEEETRCFFLTQMWCSRISIRENHEYSVMCIFLVFFNPRRTKTQGYEKMSHALSNYPRVTYDDHDHHHDATRNT